MSKNYNYNDPVILKYINEEYYFNTLRDACYYLGKTVLDLKYGRLQTYFNDDKWGISKIRGDNLIIIDYNIGDVLPIWLIQECYNNISYEDWKDYRKRTIKSKWLLDRILLANVNFRNGPIKGIRKFKPSHRYHRRKCSTTREIRLNQIFEDEDIKEYKIKGRKRYLPCLWDDLMDSSYGNRSWKEFRKTQYKCNRNNHWCPLL